MNRKKLNINLYRLVAAVVLCIGLLYVNDVRAQSTSDSLQYSLQITVLKGDFQKSIALFRLDKYKLANPFKLEGTKVFDEIWKQYQGIYQNIPQANRKQFFTEDFFEVAMTAAQLYRDITAVTMLTEHKQEVSPSQPVHHDKWDYSNSHSSHNHKD